MRCRNSLELCPLLQWAAQQPQESINNIDLLLANNNTRACTNTHTHTYMEEEQADKWKEREREKKGHLWPPSPSTHLFIGWENDPWPLFPASTGHVKSTDGTCPPSSESYSYNASVKHTHQSSPLPCRKLVQIKKCVKLISERLSILLLFNILYPVCWGYSHTSATKREILEISTQLTANRLPQQNNRNILHNPP